MKSKVILCAAAAFCLLAAGCQKSESPVKSASESAPGSAAVSSVSTSLTPDEGAQMLEEKLGKVDEATGNALSYGYIDTITLDGVDYHRYRVSWLVDGDHMSYLTDYLVSLDGSVLKEYVPESSPGDTNAELESAADALLASMSTRDFSTIADWCSEDGVRFSPYGAVDFDADLVFSADQIASFGTDTETRSWGIYDGSGEPIEMTPGEYWDRFVWNADWSKAPIVSVNETHCGGNTPENVADAYPDCSYVEYYYDGIEAQYGGTDWCGLKLVFSNQNGGWKLCGIIHSEMTV